MSSSCVANPEEFLVKSVYILSKFEYSLIPPGIYTYTEKGTALI